MIARLTLENAQYFTMIFSPLILRGKNRPLKIEAKYINGRPINCYKPINLSNSLLPFTITVT